MDQHVLMMLFLKIHWFDDCTQLLSSYVQSHYKRWFGKGVP